MAAQPGRAPAAGARRLPQHDGARRAPTLARRPRPLLRTGVVQPAGLRGSTHRHRHGVSLVGRAPRPGQERDRRTPQPARLGWRGARARRHGTRRAVAAGAAARGAGRRGPRRRRPGGVRPLVWPVEGAARPGASQACSHPRAPLGCAAVNPPPALPASPGTIVVALGGNAVAPPGERPTISNQFRHTRASLAPIVDLAREGWRIALVRGTGPPVGDALARNEIAADEVEPLPLGVLVAATAGWMGYMIQQSLQNALARAGVTRQVVTLITQTLCDPHDPNLRSPTKPIGHALDPVRVARLQARGVPVKEEQRGRWRRVAPSTRPSAVVEREMIHHLVAAGHIVVACGGGGPPVYDDPTLRLEGLDAVADKDRVAAILGREIAADVLLILTNVDAVYHAYGTPQQKAIRRLTLAQADHLLAGKELGTGSMRPKVEAAAAFVRAGEGGRGHRAIIAELAQGLAALQGEAGTTVMRD